MYEPIEHKISLYTEHPIIVPKMYINGRFVPLRIFLYEEANGLKDSLDRYLLDSQGRTLIGAGNFN